MQDSTHLNAIPSEKYIDAEPETLIELDNYRLLIPQSIAGDVWDESVTRKTHHSWSIYENVCNSDVLCEAAGNAHQVSNDKFKEVIETNFVLKNIWLWSEGQLLFDGFSEVKPF